MTRGYAAPQAGFGPSTSLRIKKPALHGVAREHSKTGCRTFLTDRPEEDPRSGPNEVIKQ